MSNDPERKFTPSERRRPRRLEDADTAEVRFPLIWVVVGGLAALIVIGLVGLGVVNFISQSAITPTPQVLSPLTRPIETPVSSSGGTSVAVESTAPATPAATVAAAETASAPETATPPPAAATKIEVDGYVKVVGTDGVGLSMRAGPGRNNARLGVAEEGDDFQLLVLEGPRDDENQEDYVWWFVRAPDGTEGWVVEDFLVPTNAP
ncbi:MAG TPA: hypothetical protein ENK24_00785 [Anaerolineae bacterium]|nr:hypothetical protein [Anaerolineae bacterium]